MVVVAVVAVVHDSSHLFTDMLLLSSMGDLPCFGSLLFYRGQSRAEQCDQSSSSLVRSTVFTVSPALLFFSAIRSHLICGKNFKNNVWMDKEEKEKEDSL